MKRSRTASYPTPRKTPRIAKAAAKAVGASLARRAASVAAKANPYVSAGLAAYDMYKVGKDLFGAKTSKKVGRRIKGQPYRYSGRIKAGRRKKTVMDRYSQNGFVRRSQWGNVATTTRNVLYLAHSTLPVYQTVTCAFQALVKKLMMKAGFHIKNENDPLLDNQYYDGKIEIRYKVKDGDIVQTQTFTVTNNVSSLATVAADIRSWLEGLAGTANLPSQFLTLRYYVEFGSAVTAKMLQADIDLTGVRFKLYSQSELKMQNRTVNSTGNNEADDVDNVPLQGKSYDYQSNGTVYRDYATQSSAGTSAITTHWSTGTLATTLPSDTGTKMFEEIPLASQFIGCKRSGSLRVQPGSIKNSKLTTYQSFSFTKLVLLAFNKSYSSGGTGRFIQTWLGQTRLIGVEKTIMPTAADATNQITVGWEHVLSIGCECVVYQSNHTAPHVAVGTGSTVM